MATTKLQKLDGLKQRISYLIPSAPKAAQHKGGHIQMQFAEGYVSLGCNRYDVQKEQREAFEQALKGNEPTLQSASGSGSKYAPLIVNVEGARVYLVLPGGIPMPVILEIDPTVVFKVYAPAFNDEDLDGGDDGDGDGDDDND